MMTYEQAMEFINHHSFMRRKRGLERARFLLDRLGNPQDELRFIHVAGSNGKGSTCSMLSYIMREQGYRTGLFISPFLQKFGERIQVNGELIPEEQVAEIAELVQAAAAELEEKTGEPPTHFEIVTAIGMEYFRRQKCDIVVLEVGLGGEFDATNTILAPEAAVITNIGLEHTEILGDTLEEIAHTKAGIVKTGSAVVLYDGAPEVTEVVRRVCAERAVPLYGTDFSQIVCEATDLDGQYFTYRGSWFHIRLLGPHQLHNAAVVIDTVRALRDRGWKIGDEALHRGIEKAEWPARLEVLGRDPLFILDGGHNPQCAEALAQSLDTLLPGKKLTFLTGVLEDKDYEDIFRILIPYSSEIICVTPDSYRARDGEWLAEYLREKGANARLIPDLEEAVQEALSTCTEGVVAFGSLYLAGDVRTIWQRMQGQV